MNPKLKPTLDLTLVQVVLYRWNVYNVFLQVPTAVIRALASRVLVLLEDDIGGDAAATEGEQQGVSRLSTTAIGVH